MYLWVANELSNYLFVCGFQCSLETPNNLELYGPTITNGQYINVTLLIRISLLYENAWNHYNKLHTYESWNDEDERKGFPPLIELLHMCCDSWDVQNRVLERNTIVNFYFWLKSYIFYKNKYTIIKRFYDDE